MRTFSPIRYVDVLTSGANGTGAGKVAGAVGLPHEKKCQSFLRLLCSEMSFTGQHINRKSHNETYLCALENRRIETRGNEAKK